LGCSISFFLRASATLSVSSLPEPNHLGQTREAERGLLRNITVVGLAASIVNIVVGGGIFVLPALLAAEVGPVAPVVHVIGAVAVLLVAVAFISIGRTTSRSGGPYEYVRAVLGPFSGYLVGVLTWLVGAFACAGLLVGLAGMIATLHPSLQTAGARSALILALYVVPVAINLATVQVGTRVVIGLTTIKLATLLLFLAFALPMVQLEHLTWSEPPRLSDLARGAIVTFFAFGGMAMALCASGEIRAPARTVPLGVVTGMALVAVLYVAVQVVAQGVLGPALPASAAPLADAAARAGAGLRALIIVGAAISMGGALVGTHLGAARMLFAFARDGILPSAVSAVHPRSHIPCVAVLLHAVVAVILALTGTFQRLAVLTSVSVALVYLVVCFSAWILGRRSKQGRPASGFAPLQRIAAGLGCVVLLVLLSQSTRAELAAISVTLAAAIVLYAIRRSARQGGRAESSQ
jgi:basic amino acid/polyamine antiporter, APA family